MEKNINIVFKNVKRMCNSPDLNIRFINKKIGYIFLESVSSDDKISDFLVKSILKTLNNKSIFTNLYKSLKKNFLNSKVVSIKTYKDLLFYLSSGYTIVVINGYKEKIAIETREDLDRGITEPTSEVTIKGPKDSFCETLNKNIGLIRKRIKDPNLFINEYFIGRRTKTKVDIFYINDIANIDKVNLIKKKIESIDIDGIIDIGYIRDFLIDDKRSTFPLVINTERPDVCVSHLLEGKIVIMMDNSPNAIILPATLNNFLHSAEDNYTKAINTSVTRFLRFLGFIITIVTPALYIAITTFNQEVIPDTLLITLASQRVKVPFPNAFSIFILLITFELLRESDIRIPSLMGTSMSIVGALVLGDAAVNAGLVSPMAVIVVAITSITGLLFTDPDIINAFRIWRFIFLILSTTMGLVGFLCAGILFITRLCSLESIGVYYLEPYSPFNRSIFTDSIITKPRNEMFKRENYITNNTRRLK